MKQINKSNENLFIKIDEWKLNDEYLAFWVLYIVFLF
jgi:hypothetical protein